MKVMDNPTAAYTAAVDDARRALTEGEQAAELKHETTHDCAGGRLSIEICHGFCEFGLNGTPFLPVTEQRRLWDAALEPERYFRRPIERWEAWESTRDGLLCEWTPFVDERVRARSEAWISSDRVLAASVIAVRRRFFQATYEARRQHLVIPCGDNLSWRTAARSYLTAVKAAFEV